MIHPTVASEKKRSPKVLDYLDYRIFLSDYLAWRREGNPRLTQRAFAGEIGLTPSGSSMLPAILKGRRKLSQNLRVKFSEALKLPDKEARYFDLLVQFNQARSGSEKSFFFSQLSRFRTSKASILKESQFEYFSNWYYSAVRTFFLFETKERNPTVIAGKLFPEVGADKVEEAISVLLDLGLIRKTANGYAVTDRHIMTPPDVKAVVARKHVHEMSRLSLEVLDRSPSELRQFNTLMFSLSATGFAALKDRIRGFFGEVQEILDQDQGEDRIYNLNLQLFPSSRLPGLKPAAAKTKV